MYRDGRNLPRNAQAPCSTGAVKLSSSLDSQTKRCSEPPGGRSFPRGSRCASRTPDAKIRTSERKYEFYNWPWEVIYAREQSSRVFIVLGPRSRWSWFCGGGGPCQEKLHDKGLLTWAGSPGRRDTVYENNTKIRGHVLRVCTREHRSIIPFRPRRATEERCFQCPGCPFPTCTRGRE